VVEKGAVPLHDLLRELFVRPMKLLEDGIRVPVKRGGITRQWLLAGTLHGLPSDHVGQIEMMGFTGPTTLLPSKYNLLMGRPRKKKKKKKTVDESNEEEEMEIDEPESNESTTPPDPTPKIVEVTRTFDGRYQRTGRKMLAVQGKISTMNAVGNPSKSKIEEELRSQGMTSLVSSTAFESNGRSLPDRFSFTLSQTPLLDLRAGLHLVCMLGIDDLHIIPGLLKKVLEFYLLLDAGQEFADSEQAIGEKESAKESGF
jgi:hypothetical protein